MSGYHAVIAFREEGAGTMKAHPATLKVVARKGRLHLTWCHPNGGGLSAIPLADVDSITFVHEEGGS